jgi:SAM-dependent methyltransferase
VTLLWSTLVLIAVAVVFVVLTDGKYFGKRLMRLVYDRWGPAWFAPLTEKEAERWRGLVEELGISGDEKVLDVGTALGDLPLTIAALPWFRGQVFGLDWSPRMLAEARRRAERAGTAKLTSFRVGDAREPLPFSAQSFDLVVCIGVLEGLREPKKLLDELVRVLRPAGRLVLSCYRGVEGRLGGLDLRDYMAHLEPLGFGEYRRMGFRRSHDLLIVGRGEPTDRRIESGQSS